MRPPTKARPFTLIALPLTGSVATMLMGPRSPEFPCPLAEGSSTEFTRIGWVKRALMKWFPSVPSGSVAVTGQVVSGRMGLSGLTLSIRSSCLRIWISTGVGFPCASARNTW